MSYQSIDQLQNILASTIFSNKKDAKKAAGRALGTLVEIITYYLLREWGLIANIAIETKLPEFGNSEITHNVEFTLHRVKRLVKSNIVKPLSYSKARTLFNFQPTEIKSGNCIDRNDIIKNSAIIGKGNGIVGCCNISRDMLIFSEIEEQAAVMFECKRVGVEEGQRKGPQTIEKAKQGAYVALKASSLQKIKDKDGNTYGVYFRDGSIYTEPYEEALVNCLNSANLQNFILTFGVVSNHGNWFTSQNMNKELKVLAQSYDRLLFLTDEGLCTFINDAIISPSSNYNPIREAFISSYKEGKKNNYFTKSRISLDAHEALSLYFHNNLSRIESWFNIISPQSLTINEIKNELISFVKISNSQHL